LVATCRTTSAQTPAPSAPDTIATAAPTSAPALMTAAWRFVRSSRCMTASGTTATP
jgi:hypothetical protein